MNYTNGFSMSDDALKFIRVTALLDLSLAINSALTLDNIFDAVHDTVFAHFHTEKMYLFMQREASHRRFSMQTSFGSREESPHYITDDGPLAEFFARRRLPLRLADLGANIKSEIQSLTDLDPDLVVPCYSKEELCGFLIMGVRESKSYVEDDFYFFQQLGLVLGAALENARLMRAATFDDRTGLFNYQAARPRILKEMYRAERYNHDLSIILLDIDHFKKLNDTYGHVAGDRVLAEYGVRLRRELRQSDFAARYGGEEFLIACPHQTPAAALNLAERVRKSLVREPFEIPEPIKSSASMGIASYRPDTKETLEELVARADKALYASKRDGRDRITVAQ
jgi:diguanylate cyclase (GGDEF)-like protein